MADLTDSVRKRRARNTSKAKPLTKAQEAKLIKDAGGTEGGTVSKVIYVDEKGEPVGEWVSQQMPEDPWGSVTVRGLQEPPFRLEQLVYLAEIHPVHSSALEQKTVDVCGTGWTWEPINPEDELEDDVRTEITDWWESLAPDDESMQEVVSAVWDDVETTGWGLIEIARDPQGIARRFYHVPAHTVRAHRDGFRLVQVRANKKVWFKRWGAEDATGKPVEVDSVTGSMTSIKKPGNDLVVVKKKSRRSSWYGIPGYVSCIGYLTLALAARDDNLLFFANRREPRWAIILWGLSENPTLEDDIRRALTVDLKSPHRNIILPIEGEGKLEFQQLSGKGPVDGSFDKLAERADKAILIAHRIPGERLANSTVGSLGGNIAGEVNRVYKEGVVTPSQEVYNNRLNKLVAVEWAVAHGAATQEDEKATKAAHRRAVLAAMTKGEEKPVDPLAVPAKLVLDDLDIDTDREELDLAVIAFHADVITLGECRKRMGLEPLMETARAKVNPETGALEFPTDPDTGQPRTEGEEYPSPYNDLLYTELPGVGAGASGPSSTPPEGSGGLAGAPVKASVDQLRQGMAQLLRDGKATHEALADLASRGDDSAVLEAIAASDAAAAARGNQ